MGGGGVFLVRHTQVAEAWVGRCYGSSDVALSRAGRIAARDLLPELTALQPARIVSSPLRRARFLAGLLSRALPGVPLSIEPRLAECHFGSWEGQSWQQIYESTGDAMMGLVAAPDAFRPGGDGETTYEMRDRAMAWLEGTSTSQTIVAICHGGPIAAIRGSRAGRPVAEWPALVPAYGGIHHLA